MALISDRVTGKQQIVGDRFYGIPQKGDRLSQTDNDDLPLEEWVFNGFVWMSSSKKAGFNSIDITRTKNLIIAVDRASDIYLKRLDLNYYVDGRNTNTRHWKFNLFKVSNTYSFTLVATTNSLSSNYASLCLQINQQDLLNFSNTIYYLLQTEVVGRAGTLSVSGELIYHNVRETIEGER